MKLAWWPIYFYLFWVQNKWDQEIGTIYMYIMSVVKKLDPIENK